MKERKIFIYSLRVVLILATMTIVGWIFSNSLQNAEESSSVSGNVTDIIQNVIDSMSGGESDIIISEHFVRKLAHFTEYTIYGLFLMFTCLSFTKKKIYFIIPAVLGVIVPIIDELLQLTSEGRYCSPLDMLIDACGSATGILLAYAVFMLISYIIRKKKYKEMK